MKIKIILEIAIICFGIVLLVIAIIFFISSFFQNRKIQSIISPFGNWFKNKGISLNELVQSITSILALLIALYALTMDSIRDNDSSIRYSESVGREKEQHSEMMNVYDKQTKLLEKYSVSADSMLGLLKKQAQIADMQFQSQIVLTQPGININYHIQDTNRTSLNYEGRQWVMPEAILAMYNFGSRPADKVCLNVQIISPNAKSVHRFDKIVNLHVLPKATLNEFLFPIIASEDKDFFLMVVEIEWVDLFNKNRVFKEKLYDKFIRESNNYYTSGQAEEIYIDLINKIISKPSKIVTSNPIIRRYMYDVYHK